MQLLRSWVQIPPAPFLLIRLTTVLFWARFYAVFGQNPLAIPLEILQENVWYVVWHRWILDLILLLCSSANNVLYSILLISILLCHERRDDWFLKLSSSWWDRRFTKEDRTRLSATTIKLFNFYLRLRLRCPIEKNNPYLPVYVNS
jgi:hypothetical protein